jgi:glycosyltransferase involved in cell wall biosynthesis
VKLGVIVRCDQRGLAHQSTEFWEHMGRPRALVVTMDEDQWPEEPGRFGNDSVVVSSNLSQNLNERGLDERRCRKFLEGLDVVFAVETVYDWRFIDWARDMRVKVVIQGNGEFAAHHHHPEWTHPALWAWPTPWLIDELETLGYNSRVVPVPIPDREQTAADPESDTLNVLHVIGKQAAGDRNGTLEFIEAVASLRQKVNVRIVTQGDRLPRTEVRHRNGTVNVEVITGGVADRWEMYEGMHMLISPRKYGGLHLPALEAMATGMAVMMTDCSPNEIWPGPRLKARKGRIQRSPFGKIQTQTTHPIDIASTIDSFARNRKALADEMEQARWWASHNRWDDLREMVYTPLFEEITS